MGRLMDDPAPAPPFDRRTERGLRFDPEAGRLSLGSSTSIVPPGAGNRVVLAAYVDLAAHSRGRSVAELIEVRQGDIEALARALDLDAADLAQQVQEVLGATRAEALRLVQRLRETRVIGGITKAATAGMLAGSLLAGSGAVAAASPAHDGGGASAPAAATMGAPDAAPRIDGPVTVTDDGVGLIPAVTQDHGGGVLIPPTTEEPEEPGVVLLPPITVERDDPAGS